MTSIAYYIMITSALMFVFFITLYVMLKYEHSKWLNKVFSLYDMALLSKEESDKKIAFRLKLTQAGMTRKDFNEIILAGIIAGLAISSLILILDQSLIMNIAFGSIGLGIATLTPFIYLDEQRKARIKRIDNDLAVFIDLLIIILEGGGGLNNAIDEVTTEGATVLGKDLLEESRRFKNEFITYSSEVAYANLARRTGSEAVGTIVGFMKLSEETGIGVKTIFENQAQEIKANDMLNVEKRAATMNISITLTMFIFIIPAVIAMIVFPMMADALMPGF